MFFFSFFKLQMTSNVYKTRFRCIFLQKKYHGLHFFTCLKYVIFDTSNSIEIPSKVVL